MKNDKNKSMARLQLSQTHGSEVILPQDIRPITDLSNSQNIFDWSIRVSSGDYDVWSEHWKVAREI